MTFILSYKTERLLVGVCDVVFFKSTCETDRPVKQLFNIFKGQEYIFILKLRFIKGTHLNIFAANVH